MGIIIFDLFDTILDKEEFDYFAGLKMLYKKYLKNKISYESLEQIVYDFRVKYMLDRNRTNREIPFYLQLEYIESKYPEVLFDNKMEIEWEFFKACRKERIANNIDWFLRYITKKDYNCYILSNSIFSGETLGRYLKQYNIDNFFKKIYSSADIIFRKPSLESFIFIIKSEKIDMKNGAYYIGNSLEKDILPSKEIGFTPFFRNLNNEHYDGISFLDYKELIDYFE